MHRMKDLAIVSVKWYVSIKSLSQLRDPCERVGIKSVKSREDRRHKGKKKTFEMLQYKCTHEFTETVAAFTGLQKFAHAQVLCILIMAFRFVF